MKRELIARYFGSDQALHTHVGHKESNSMVATGRDGILVYGPYIALDAGVYSIKVYGKSQFIGESFCDVAVDRGGHILITQPLHEIHKHPPHSALLWGQSVMLDQAHQDVEVRVYVDANCQLSVDRIEIIKILPTDFAFVNVSHEKDLKWSSVLYRSWEKFVYPKRSFYLIIPERDLTSFSSHFSKLWSEGVVSEIPIIITEESVSSAARITIPTYFSGWLVQQVLKLCFAKSGMADNYITIDSATIFTKPLDWRKEFFHEGKIVTSARAYDRAERSAYYRSIGENGWLNGRLTNISECFEKIEQLLGNETGTAYHNIGETNFFSSRLLLELDEWAHQHGFNGFVGLIEFIPLEPTWYGSFVANMKNDLFIPRDPDLTQPCLDEDCLKAISDGSFFVGDRFFGVRFQTPASELADPEKIYTKLIDSNPTHSLEMRDSIESIESIDNFMNSSAVVFDHNSALLHTGVGVKYPYGIQTTGREGVLIFGPYMPLPPGEYTVELDYKNGPNSIVRLDGVVIDIVSHELPHNIYARQFAQDLLKPGSECEDGGKILFTFSAEQGAEHLEVRVFVSDKSEITIEKYSIQLVRSIRHKHNSRASHPSYRNRFKDFQAIDIICNKIMTDTPPLEVLPADRSREIIVIQTADANRYYPMLIASAKFNRHFCRNDNLSYQAFVGMKTGKYPHHTMFNRVFLLQELIERNFSGWVIYLDADAFFCDPLFSFRDHLEKLRKKSSSMFLHYEKDPINNDLISEVNDGAFAMDLGSDWVRRIVKAWYMLYVEHYTDIDYERATSWNDLIDDQTALRAILGKFRQVISGSITFEQFQGRLIQQCGRSDGDIPAVDDIQRRIELINSEGIAAFENID